MTITIDGIRSQTDPKIFERGKNYYESRMIISPVIRGNRLEAFSQGSMIYQVSATLEAEHIGSASCTCPYDWGGLCKHLVALLLTYLHEPNLFVQRPTISTLLANKSQQALIDLVETMLDRHADLLELVDPELDLPEDLFGMMNTNRYGNFSAIARDKFPLCP
ncbi:MAG: SWIM zinc finger family protein [Phototrophicaceae bacterium]